MLDIAWLCTYPTYMTRACRQVGVRGGATGEDGNGGTSNSVSQPQSENLNRYFFDVDPTERK